MTKQKLYIHIGTSKTGTTALQNFFYINQDVLESHGIHYPLNDVWYRAHHRLGWVFNFRSMASLPVDLKSPEQEWSEILESGGDKTLISSETLSKCNPENIGCIKGYILEYDVKIIVYLRRQDAMLSSVMNQLTKHNNETETDVQKIPREKDYFKMIQPWVENFGRENIIVRPYEKGQFYGGSIFSDFLHFVFGLKLTDEFKIPERDHNSRLHRIALEYKRFLNFLPLTIEQKRDTVELLRQYSQQLYAQQQEDYDISSPSQCLEIIQQCAESNEKIAREFLKREDGKLFYDPLPNPKRPWKSYPGLLSKDDVRQISHLIVERDQEFAKRLALAIRTSKRSNDNEIKIAAKKLAAGLNVLMNRRERSEVYKERCIRAVRFIYHKLPKRVQPGLKKVVSKLKNVKEDNITNV